MVMSWPVKGLDDEVADHPAVLQGHPGPEGVEDPGDAGIHLILAVIVHHQGFRHPFAFVIAAPNPDGIDVPPIPLRLGVDLGIAIDLRGGRQEDAGLHPLGQPQHVERPQHVGLDGLHRVVLIVHRRGRTGQVIDLVDLQHDGVHHVVPDYLQPGIVPQVEKVGFGAGKKIIQAKDVVIPVQQALHQMGADEPCPTGNQDAGHMRFSFHVAAWLHCNRLPP